MATDQGGNWWRDLLSSWSPSGYEGGLRLAIRNGYVNFYSRGQSVARVGFGADGTPKLYVHRKYALKESGGGRNYIRLSTNQGRDENGQLCAWGGPDMLRAWIRRSECYSGPEKSHIDQALADMPNVIDLEMGLPAAGDRKTALRMDMVALERLQDRIQIIFWEAKMIGDGRLRSRSEPEVFKQVSDYERFLEHEHNRTRVIEAYRRTCKLLRDLNISAEKLFQAPPIDDLVREAAGDDSPLDVARTPRLLIFDDGVKRNEEAWQKHLSRLDERMDVKIVRPRRQVELGA